MRAIPDGETLALSVWRRISREAKLAFAGAFAMGLLTHLYMLVNKLPNHDDILGLFIDNDSTFYGRWFLSVPSAFSASFSVPWVIGLLSLLWLSLAAVCVVRLLRVRKPAMILLISAVMACFPVVGYTFCYMFTADAYFFALLLAALGAYLTDRYKLGFLPGGVCIGLSLATYQAYVFFAIGLLALRLLSYLLFDGDAGRRTIGIKLLQFAAALAVGAIVYRIGLSASLALKNVALKTYMGLDNAGSVSVRDAIQRIPLALSTYAAFFTGRSELWQGRLLSALFALVNLAAAALSVAALIRCKGQARALRIALSIAIICAIPLISTGIVLLSAMGLHPLMQYPVCLVYLLALMLYDGVAEVGRHAASRAEEGATAPKICANARALLGYALAACVALSSFMWAVDANQTYLALELKLDNMMSLATRMVDRVERLPEYVPDETPVWYTGTLSDAHYGAVKSDEFARASATDMTGRAWNYTTFMNNLYFAAFVKDYIGVTFVAPEDADAYAVMETDAYKAMPYFPREGSVRYIDGVIIINGGPNPQSPP